MIDNHKIHLLIDYLMMCASMCTAIIIFGISLISFHFNSELSCINLLNIIFVIVSNS